MNPITTLFPSRDIQRVPASLLRVDVTNYRKKFSGEALAELAESIYEEGIIQNLECGPDGEVHLGNRRLAALQTMVLPRLEREIAALGEFEGQANWSELAGVDDPDERLVDLRASLEDLRLVPVRVLSAEEVKDAKIRQIVENLQREGVSARDEAEGFARLLDERDAEGNPRWTNESLAKRIGKGMTGQYVSNRLKLLRAPQAILDALEAGEIPIRVAELVGRVPNAATREEVAKRVLRPQFSTRPLSEKETSDLLKADYLIALSKATFDREDADLVPDAGPCSLCPFRSGNDPSLEGDLMERRATGSERGGGFATGGKGGASAGISPDLCTNPACFRAKCDAAWSRVAAQAERDGYDVLPPGEAEKIFWKRDGRLKDDGRLMHNAPWVDLDDKPDYDFTELPASKTPKWRTVLKDSGIRITKARNPVTGRTHDLVRLAAAKEAVRLLIEKAKAEPAPVTKGEGKPKQAELFEGFAKKQDRDAEAKKEAARQKLEEKAKRAESIAGVDAILDAMTAMPAEPLNREAMLVVLETVLRDSAENCAFFALWLELERPFAGASGRDFLKPIMEHVRERVPGYRVDELFALIAFASIAGSLKWQGVKCPGAKALAKVFGVDLDAVAKAARKEFLQEERAKKKGKGSRVTGHGKDAPLIVVESVAEAKAVSKERLAPDLAEIDWSTCPPCPEGMKPVEAASRYYDAMKEAGTPVSSVVAANAYGVLKDVFRNYRANAPRVEAKKAIVAAKGKGGAKA